MIVKESSYKGIIFKTNNQLWWTLTLSYLPWITVTNMILHLAIHFNRIALNIMKKKTTRELDKMSKMTSSRALCMICASAWTSLHFISHLSFMELKNFEFDVVPSSWIIVTSSLNSRLEMRLQRFNSSIPNISNHVEFQFPQITNLQARF